MISNRTIDCFGQDINLGDYIIFIYYDSLTVGRVFKITDQKAFVVAVPNISKTEKWHPFVTNTHKRNIIKCTNELTLQYKDSFDLITSKIIPQLEEL